MHRQKLFASPLREQWNSSTSAQKNPVFLTHTAKALTRQSQCFDFFFVQCIAFRFLWHTDDTDARQMTADFLSFE